MEFRNDLLRLCKACCKQISKNAESCPNCGHIASFGNEIESEKREQKRLAWQVMGIIFLCIVVFFIADACGILKGSVQNRICIHIPTHIR